MANVLFIKTLSKLLSDEPFKKGFLQPFAALGIKYGLKVFAKRAALNEIVLDKSELFIKKKGKELLDDLAILRKECTCNEVSSNDMWGPGVVDNPFNTLCCAVFYASGEDLEAQSKLRSIYLDDVDNVISVCSKYPEDDYFIPKFILQHSISGRTSVFLDRLELFGYSWALYELENEGPQKTTTQFLAKSVIAGGTISSMLDMRRDIEAMRRDYVLGHANEEWSGLADGLLRGSALDFMRRVKKWEAKTGKGIRLDSSDRKLLAASESKEYKLYELKTLKALQQETNEIGHCVGRSDTYFKKIENDLSLIFSLKHLNKAVATLEYSPATYNLIQCKGHNNDPVPEEHLTALIPLLNSASVYINKVFESKVTEEFKAKLHSFVGPMLVATESKMFSHADLLAGHRLHTNLHAPNVNVRTLEVEYPQRHAWGRMDALTTEVRLTVELSQSETNNIRELQNRWGALGRDRIVDAGVRLVGAITTEAPYEAVYPSVELTFSVTVEEFQAVAGAFEVNSFLRVASTLVGLSLRSPIVGRLTENEARHAV